MAILRKKAEEFHVELAQDVLAFLAQRVRTNVRHLEGALMRVASYQSLSDREISRETVEQLLRDILREEAKKTVITNKPSCHDSVSVLLPAPRFQTSSPTLVSIAGKSYT